MTAPRSPFPAGWTQSIERGWSEPAVLVVMGLVAIACGLHAEQLLATTTPDIADATRWYILAIGFLVTGWWGNYTGQSRLDNPSARRLGLGNLRLGIALRAVVLNLVSLFLIFSSSGTTGAGVLAWFASLGLFVYACRDRVTPSEQPVFELTVAPWKLPRKYEVLVFTAIMTVALVMRLWRLGDIGPGMHGDEGEAGSSALSILGGNLVSPFERGWSTQSNVYYWTLAIVMRFFGTNLAGLRVFAVICGLATVAFVYLLARELFGQRCAIVSGAFLSFQTADVIFSRQQFSNDTVPAFLAGMAYFLVRGIRTRRHVDFAMGGIISAFALYYYAGGRLVAPTGLLFLGYMAVTRRKFVSRYWTQLCAFLGGALLTSGPFLAYNYLIAPIQGVGYPNDRFVWYHKAELAAQFGVSGWPAILWHQLTLTFSIVTYHYDVSAWQIGQFAVPQPLESVLVVLGLAWAMVRWKDARFSLLTICFWASIIFGGVITNEAPNLPRIVGILAIMPLLIGVVLDHFAGQLQLALTSVPALKSFRQVAPISAAVVLAGATAVPGVANWHNYTTTYMNTDVNQLVSVQAKYVHELGPSYYYYDLGDYFPLVATLYWSHGDNRFLNPHAGGEDVTDIQLALPVADNGPTGRQDVIFMVWAFSPQYIDVLNTIKRFYPHGIQQVYREMLHPGQLPILVTYRVSSREIDATRGLQVRFIAANGQVIDSDQSPGGYE